MLHPNRFRVGLDQVLSSSSLFFSSSPLSYSWFCLVLGGQEYFFASGKEGRGRIGVPKNYLHLHQLVTFVMTRAPTGGGRRVEVDREREVRKEQKY